MGWQGSGVDGSRWRNDTSVSRRKNCVGELIFGFHMWVYVSCVVVFGGAQRKEWCKSQCNGLKWVRKTKKELNCGNVGW